MLVSSQPWDWYESCALFMIMSITNGFCMPDTKVDPCRNANNCLVSCACLTMASHGRHACSMRNLFIFMSFPPHRPIQIDTSSIHNSTGRLDGSGDRLSRPHPAITTSLNGWGCGRLRCADAETDVAENALHRNNGSCHNWREWEADNRA